MTGATSFPQVATAGAASSCDFLAGAAPRDALLAGVRAGSAAAAQLGACPAPR
jgi:hypothetical protein